VQRVPGLCNTRVRRVLARSNARSAKIDDAMKLSGNFGLRLLGVWLVLEGVLPLIGLRIPNSAILLTMLAIVAGVLLILDR
jgi:hypothetical protein